MSTPHSSIRESAGRDTPAHGKRLAIIVPYRDRLAHLQRFVPHMINYFARDEPGRAIDYSIHIVEQLGTERFHRGLLCNAGFLIARDSADYFCFHDVDYLPIRADYSYPEKPTRLIWHGLALKEDYGRFFGAVVAFSKADFLTVNGFSNAFWGWGPEDLELGLRCAISGLGFDKRDGTFEALPHPHAGFNPAGEPTAEAMRNFERFNSRFEKLKEIYPREGVNTADFRLVESSNLVVDGRPAPNVFLHKVDPGKEPAG